jgi:hypothetical protein
MAADENIRYLRVVKNSALILHFLALGLLDLMNIRHNKFTIENNQIKTMDACMEVVEIFAL